MRILPEAKSKYCTFGVQVTTHFSDVYDKDNLVFGANLPNISVTVQGASSSENPEGE